MASRRAPDFGPTEFAQLIKGLTGVDLSDGIELPLSDGTTLQITHKPGPPRKPKPPAWAVILEMQTSWQDATLASLKAQHRALAKRYHPDKATSEAERKRFTSKMAAINNAFEEGKLEAIRPDR